MSKASNDKIRAAYVAKLTEWLSAAGEETLRTNSNEVTIPVVDEDGNEAYLVFTLKVPTGSRDGDVYDGYEMAEEYARKTAAKTEKAKVAAAKKAAKIASDNAKRAQLIANKQARAARENGEI